MKLEIHSGRYRRAWAMVRQVPGSAVGKAWGKGAPAFISGGAGNEAATTLAGGIGGAFRVAHTRFPFARLTETLGSADTQVADYRLKSWGDALGSDFRRTVVPAATDSFRQGAVDAGFGGSVRQRAGSDRYRDDLARAVSDLEPRLVRAADEDVQRIIRKVSEIVEAGLGADLEPKAIVAGVDDYLRDEGGVRARRIAWTVVFRWWHGGRHWAFRRAGASHKIWHVSTGVDNCPLCLGNVDAGEIEIERSFPSGHLHPLAHPWCHCWLEYTGLPR